MSVAEQYILSGTYKNILVIGVDIFSTITDWKRRDCVFFGDGGGAVVMSASEELGFAGFVLYSDSENRDGFYCNHGENFNMDTRRVYNSAIKLLPLAINGILERCDMTINDIDYIIPHQPSIRILMEVARRVKIPIERVLMNMDKYGNTVAATIPILLHESWNKFKEGDVILFAAIGSGWTYGASIYII
jgi:3-oxoacyl-[acyl-carrier-protein] synthase-3